MRRVLSASALLAVVFACSSPDTEVPVLPASLYAERQLALEARYTPPRWPACIYASPLADGGSVLVAGGDGSFSAIDPHTGAKIWSIVLPAPEGERAFIVATPVVVGRRAVVAYHTIAASSAELHVATTHIRHRVAVVDLDAHVLDASRPPIDLSATSGNVVFTPSHALGRGALVESGGRVYVTFGNVRDVQPYHGWIFEVTLDPWRISAAMPTTADTDCGSEGGDGSQDMRCGGGLWAPSGPLVEDDGKLVVPTGNGQLDLAHHDYANTLMRLGPGLTFDPACDASACASFSADTLDAACTNTCRDIFVPRLLDGETSLCSDKNAYRCWAARDFIDGGSTPVPVTTSTGRRILVYPTKDGHLWLVDEAHLGTVYAHDKIADTCGTATDECVWGWAGTVVTKPVVTRAGKDPVVIVPTFMPDATHAAGVVAVKIVDDGKGVHAASFWQFPPPDHAAARTRFRRHPSRGRLFTFDSRELVAVVDAAPPHGRGHVYVLQSADGKIAGEADLSSAGFRFAQPLVLDDTLIVNSCDSDSGEGSIEAWTLRGP